LSRFGGWVAAGAAACSDVSLADVMANSTASGKHQSRARSILHVDAYGQRAPERVEMRGRAAHGIQDAEAMSQFEIH
jgi:hypothetical protein